MSISGATDMLLYYVTCRTIPIDWAASSKEETVGYHKSRAGAEARIEELKKSKDYGVYWGDLQIRMVPLHE